MKIRCLLHAEASTPEAPRFDFNAGPGEDAALRAILPRGRASAPGESLSRDETIAEISRLRGLGHEVKIPSSAQRAMDGAA